MAVKAKAEITISRIIDIEKVTRYYLLQSSTSAAPSKPTTNPPGGSWVTTEPAFGSDTTKTLYFVDLTVMTNGSFSYSAVSKSSSYEAAKEAWNKANNAQNTANDAKDKVDLAEKTGTGGNLIKNGYGELLDNTNFKNGTFTRGDCPDGCYGYFRYGETEKIPFNPNLTYELEYYVRLHKGASGKNFFSIVPYDVDGLIINHYNVLNYNSNLFYLSQDLKNGDTVAHFLDLNKWYSNTVATYSRSFLIFGYKDSTGYIYPDGTYSRNYYEYVYADNSSVDKVNNTITLRSPWKGGTVKTGTCIGQGSDGQTYCYYGQNGALTNPDWKKYTAIVRANNSDVFARRLLYAKSISVFLYNDVADYAKLYLGERKIADAYNEYYLSTSKTALSGGSWSVTAPEWINGRYMWSRTVKVDGVGNKTYSPGINGVCIAGAAGANGKGIKSTQMTYQAGLSATDPPTGTWLGSPQKTDTLNPYLWTRIVITYDDNTTSDPAYSVSSTMDSVNVGGRNLLYQYFKTGGATKIIDDRTIQVGQNPRVDTYFYLRTHEKLYAGEQYTISCDVEGLPEDTYWEFGIAGQSSPFRLNVNKNGRCTATGIWYKDVDAGATFVLDDVNNRIVEHNNPILKLSNFKLEKGNVATDWTPAPEDMADQKSVTKVSETVNEIEHTTESNSARIESLNGIVETKADSTTVTEVTERVSNVEQNLSGFRSEVKSTYTTKEDFENLQVGGKNLWIETGYTKNTYTISTGTSAGWFGSPAATLIKDDVGDKSQRLPLSIWQCAQYIKIHKDQIYTLSCDVKLDPSASEDIKSFYLNSDVLVINRFEFTEKITKEWKRISITYTAPVSGLERFHLRGTGDDIDYFWIKHIKMEIGNTPTDWTPAPEDLIAEAQDYATTAKNEAISAADSDATSKANQAEANAKADTADKLKSYVTTKTYDSYVEQTDSKIAAKLESSEFTSFQDGEYTSFKQSTNEFIGTVDKWEMKWDKIFNSADANEDTYQSYITFQNGEQILGNSKSNIKLHLKNDIIQFEDSNGNALASFDATTIYLGKSSSNSVIDLCNGAGKIKGVNYEHNSQLSIYGTEGITLYPTENNNVFASLDSSSIWLYAHNAEKTKGSSIIITSNGINITSDDDVSIIGVPLVLWGELQAHSDATFETKITVPTIYTNNWFRSTGNSGWYNENYGGGIFMEDTTWVKVYNGKAFYAPGEIRSDNHMTVNGLGSYGQFRALYGKYGFIIRNDGSDTYFLLTNSGDPWGCWNGLRPLRIQNSTGQVFFEHLVRFGDGAQILASGGGNYSFRLTKGGNLASMNAAGEDGTAHGNIGSSANYWNGVYYKSLNKVSDKRKKRDLGNLGLEEALMILNQTRTVKYSMLDESEDMIQYGVFAQDIRDMLRDSNLGYRTVLNIGLMDGSEETTTNLYESEERVSYSIDYIQFIAPLIKGWQYHESELEELQRAHQELQGKHNSLEGQIEALRDKLHELEMAM